jgi:hypothetical protein
LLLSMHGHGKAANRCLGQKRSANLSLSAYMQVGGANETNGQRCFSSPAPAALRPILVRLQPAQLAALDAWIARQDAQLSRPEAIRRLLEQALAVSQPVKSRIQKARWLLRSWTGFLIHLLLMKSGNAENGGSSKGRKNFEICATLSARDRRAKSKRAICRPTNSKLERWLSSNRQRIEMRVVSTRCSSCSAVMANATCSSRRNGVVVA